MQKYINRAKSQISEIISICNDLKSEINTNQIWNLNDGMNCKEYIESTDLESKKLFSRCKQVTQFCKSENLSQTLGLERIMDNIWDKPYINFDDIDRIIYEFDELNRGLDNLEFAFKNDESQQILKSELVPKLFISHSSKDVEYVKCFIELLENIGISEKQLFCSSLPEYGVPLNQDIYDYLKSQFENYSLQVFFFLSDHYYESAACLNEMGAAWVLQASYYSILLPKFEFKNIRGAINPNKISIKLDNVDCKARLNELKDKLIYDFKLQSISQTKWERHRDDFTKKIGAII